MTVVLQVVSPRRSPLATSPGWHNHNVYRRKKVLCVIQMGIKILRRYQETIYHQRLRGPVERNKLVTGLYYTFLCKEQQHEPCQNPNVLQQATHEHVFAQTVRNSDFMTVPWACDIYNWCLCSQPSTVKLNRQLPENTELADCGTLFSEQMMLWGTFCFLQQPLAEAVWWFVKGGLGTLLCFFKLEYLY